MKKYLKNSNCAGAGQVCLTFQFELYKIKYNYVYKVHRFRDRSRRLNHETGICGWQHA